MGNYVQTGDRRMTKDELELIEARLINWALFLRHGGIPMLGYITWPQIMKQFWGEPGNGVAVANEIDAAHIADIISTMDVAGRDGEWKKGDLYAFVLKIEYIEIGRPVEERARHVRTKFKRRCGERQYYKHLAKAKTAVNAFVEPIK